MHELYQKHVVSQSICRNQQSNVLLWLNVAAVGAGKSSHCLSFVDALLDLSNCLARVQTLGADLSTVHDLMTSVQLVGIVNLGHALLGEVVPGINDPSASCTKTLSA